MSVFLECVKMFIDVLAMLCVVLIVEVPFGGSVKTNARKLLIASGCMLLLEVLLEAVFDLATINRYIVTLIEFLLMLCVVFTCATEKRVRTALLTIPSVFVYMNFGQIGYLIEKILGFGNYSAFSTADDITWATVISDVVLLIILLLLKYKGHSYIRAKLSLGELILITIFCVFSPVIIVVLEALETLVQYGGYNLAWMIFVLVLNFAVIYGIAYRKKAKYYKLQSESYKSQFDDEYNYFKEYKDNNKEIAKFRHDWNNHMIVMQQLFEQEKFEEAKKYFESFPVVKKSNTTKVLSGNETVDTILAAKAEIFDKHNVELKINGSLSRLSAMESMDICILFSNLIDNALEAVARVNKKRYLHINVTESPNMLMIIFKNPTDQELLIEGDTIKSTKEDAMKHGIGLQNVAEIIEKYKGEYYIETMENEFVVKIVLPM